MAGSVIGALRASMTLETAAFDKGIDRSRTKLRQFDADTRKMAGGASNLGRDLGVGLGPVGTVLDKIGAAGLVAGAGVGAAVVAFQGMQAALKFADDLDATATKIGITAEQFQELTFAAKENDITTEALSQSLQGLNVALGAYKAGVGDAKVRKVFEALGITRESLVDVNNAAEFLPILADKIKALGSVAERVKIAKMMGVEDLVPLLVKGGDEIDRLAAKARDLGLVMSNDLTAKAADANRELEVMGDYIRTHLTIAFAELGVGITNTAAPMLDLLANLQAISRQAPIAADKLETFFTVGEWLMRAAGQPLAAAAMKTARKNVSSGPKRDEAYTGPPLTSAELMDALKPKTPGGGGAPDTDTGGGGGGSRRARSRGGASKPRYTGTLPPYILAAIAEGRFTEDSIREAFPKGDFPLSPAVAEQIIYATGLEDVEGYDASEYSQRQAGTMTTAADRMNDATAAIEATKDQNREAFREMFTGGLLAALYDGKDGVREWMRQGAERGLEQALNNLADVLFKLFSDAMGSGSGAGGGGSIGNILGAIFGGGGSSSIPGFATGGSFTVGGSGGTDSQLVQFRATPGEMVDIKHGNDNGPTGGAVVFDLRGAVMTQDLLNQMNQISAQRAGQVYGQIKGEQAQAAKAQRYRVAR